MAAGDPYDDDERDDSGRCPLVQAAHDMGGDVLVSVAVVDALVEVSENEPADLIPMVHDAVDTDALDSLFVPRFDGVARTEGHVMFPIGDYEVTVWAHGWIEVRKQDGT